MSGTKCNKYQMLAAKYGYKTSLVVFAGSILNMFRGCLPSKEVTRELVSNVASSSNVVMQSSIEFPIKWIILIVAALIWLGFLIAKKDWKLW